MPYTVRPSLRAKTVKIVSLLLIRLLPFTAKATFPCKGRLTQSELVRKIYSREIQFELFAKSKFEAEFTVSS